MIYRIIHELCTVELVQEFHHLCSFCNWSLPARRAMLRPMKLINFEDHNKSGTCYHWRKSLTHKTAIWHVSFKDHTVTDTECETVA